MESLLPAKSTAPKSQCVNCKKASAIEIYAKLGSIQINIEHGMSNRYGAILVSFPVIETCYLTHTSQRRRDLYLLLISGNLVHDHLAPRQK